MTDAEKHQAVGDIVREYLSALGKKGGAVKGGRKAEAVRTNLAKARESRWDRARDKHNTEQDKRIANGDNKVG